MVLCDTHTAENFMTYLLGLLCTCCMYMAPELHKHLWVHVYRLTFDLCCAALPILISPDLQTATSLQSTGAAGAVQVCAHMGRSGVQEPAAHGWGASPQCVTAQVGNQ